MPQALPTAACVNPPPVARLASQNTQPLEVHQLPGVWHEVIDANRAAILRASLCGRGSHQTPAPCLIHSTDSQVAGRLPPNRATACGRPDGQLVAGRRLSRWNGASPGDDRFWRLGT